MLKVTKTTHYNKIAQPKTIQPNYYLSVASVDSSMTESTCIFPETLSKRINACVTEKQNSKSTNMQTNSPPKFDTSKTMLNPPK